MADKHYKIIVSDRAKRMLGTHIRFLGQVNKESAAKNKKLIISEIAPLSSMPKRYPFFDEAYITPNKYRKMLIDKYYLVLFYIADDTVYVDYILDCRQDYQWLLK